MPTTRGAGEEAMPRRRIRRRTVSPLTGIASRRDKRAPGSPPSTMPMSVCASANRSLRRALREPSPLRVRRRSAPGSSRSESGERAGATSRPIVPGQVLEGSPVCAVNARRGLSATRTGCLGRGGVGGDQQPGCVQRQIIDVKAVRNRRHRRFEIGIVLPYGVPWRINARSPPPAPKVRMNPERDP